MVPYMQNTLIGDACLRSNEFKLLEAPFQLTEYIVRRHSSGLD